VNVVENRATSEPQCETLNGGEGGGLRHDNNQAWPGEVTCLFSLFRGAYQRLKRFCEADLTAKASQREETNEGEVSEGDDAVFREGRRPVGDSVAHPFPNEREWL